MSDIYNIADHMARMCECGCVRFNLLRSGKVECSDCGLVADGIGWHQLMEKTMLTNEQIENKDYCTNDIADLKMRLDIAVAALNDIAAAIEHDQPHHAHEMAVNTSTRIQSEHNFNCDGDVSIDKGGDYVCKCMLIASAEH